MAEVKKEHSKPFVLFCLLSNIALAIAMVLVNKAVYKYYKFPNMTLTCIHFICTSIGMVILQALGVFTVKKLPLLKMAPIALTFCGFVVLANLSLQYNTVGTYQIIKSMTIPGILIIQSNFYRRTFSLNIKLTLIPIILGVWLNSFYDLKFNVVGIIFASLGVFITSLYQVWVGEKQKEFGVSSSQLLFYQAPMCAVFLAIIIPFCEPVFSTGGIFGGWSKEAVAMVAASGTIAFLINVSIFWIIGNTSPLTYNMVGQFKFAMIIFGGFLLFNDPLQWLQGAGITFTFIGVCAYTWFKLKEQAAEKAGPAAEAEKDSAADLKEVTVADSKISNVKS